MTFDAGYENGYTLKILDILKSKSVKASFFVTRGFITKNPEIVKRMDEDGHVIANHTVNHLLFYELNQDEIQKELEGVEDAYRKLMNQDMPKYIRPPEGAYSAGALSITNKLGYKTIFWSIALHNDWNLKSQPSDKAALSLFEKYHHPGAIVLLHAVSPVIAENLDEMLQQLISQGYQFKLITDI